jgi:hypothetical protein
MMYDRVLRAELFESDRYLDLHSDTGRLAWISLLPLADDFGNIPGSARRLWRYLAPRTALKTEADVLKVLGELCDADLLRRYEVGSDPYFHIPRFRQTRDYVRRLVPGSPWDDPALCDRMVDIKARRRERDKLQLAQATAAKQPAPDSKQKSPEVRPTLPERSENVALPFGTGVGVGEGIKPPVVPLSASADADPRGSRLPKDWTMPPEWLSWAVAYARVQHSRTLPLAVVQSVADSFRDYWHGVPGQRGRKADWLATWRKWFRTELEQGRLASLPATDNDAARVLRRAT